MATATAPDRLTKHLNEWVTYIKRVSDATGLDVDVVKAWVNAENGPVGNPLNIAPRNPAIQRQYGIDGTLDGAIRATVRVLAAPQYRPILRAARTGDAQAQLHAIAASPWDAGHYGGDGRNLRGAYAKVKSNDPHSIGDVITGTVSSVGDTLTPDVGGWVSGLTRWAEEKAGLALLYLTFTGLAIAFLVLGGVRAAGGTVRRPFQLPNLQAQGFPEGY